MKLKTNQIRRVPGWVAGIQEDAEPVSGYDRYGNPIGILDACVNMIPSEVGRLAVRGGSAIKQVLADPVGNAMTSLLSAAPFSSVGAAVVGHCSTTSKHYLHLVDSDGAVQYTRTDLAWNSATPATNVLIKELWEKVYVNDATTAFGSRQQMKAFDGVGAITAITADFGSGVENVKPYAQEVFNGNLFIAGQDNGGAADAPAMVRHALLGSDPAAPSGWSGTAYNIIGAKGTRVTALKAGDNYMVISKQNEMYRLSGYGRGLDGWQYTVQPIDSTLGVGAYNPRALAFSRGYWYGISQAGPFRTDGQAVELMVGPRRRSWRSVINLDRAWVVTHPDRQHIIFGFCTQFFGKGIDTMWLWDESRELWSSDWTYLSNGVSYVAPIPTTTYQGPSAPGGGTNPLVVITPNPSLSFNYAVSGSLSNIDPTASTEVQIDRGSGFESGVILLAGVSIWSIGGLTAGQKYPVRARQTKGAITTAWSVTATGYTLLETPMIGAGGITRDHATVTMTLSVTGQSLILARNGIVIKTWASAPVGATSYTEATLTCNTFYNYEAYTMRTDWPGVINQGPHATVGVTTTACGGGPV